jgi:putative ABC transport system permease protein
VHGYAIAQRILLKGWAKADWVGVGALAGRVIAAGVGTIMSRELFGISQMDPVVHGGAFLLFASVAAVASLPSARRALRVDPARTLRHE